MKKLNKKGFTIVELVIVIAVIAILAAVLIPTFSGVVAKANASAAQQTAKSTLTNALAMSSTAQLVKDTKIVVDGYAFNYTGNQLESCDYPTTTNNKSFALGSQYNAIIISAESLEGKTTNKLVSATDYTATEEEMNVKNDVSKILAVVAKDSLGCLTEDITDVKCVKDGENAHYYINYGFVSAGSTFDSAKNYYTQSGSNYSLVDEPSATNISSYYVITWDAEIFVNVDIDKDVVVFTNFN